MSPLNEITGRMGSPSRRQEEDLYEMEKNTDGCAGIKIVDFSEVPSDVLPVVTGTLAPECVQSPLG